MLTFFFNCHSPLYSVGGPVPSQLRRLLDVFDRVSRSLDLGNNPWAEPPESIVDKGPKYIRGYFEDLYAEPCRIQRNSVKIVLVGQEAAGKTRCVIGLLLSHPMREATAVGGHIVLHSKRRLVKQPRLVK